jgi:uncharacterized protein (DUF342 family)
MPEAIRKTVDAKYAVSIAADSLTAWLTVAPAEDGGVAPSPEAARMALKQAGVIFGISEQAIESAVGPSIGCKTEVAHGKPPEPGTDGWLEPLVGVNRQRHGAADDRGQVDLRDQGSMPSVGAGDALMRRHPPVPGVPGQGVNGKVLPVGQAKSVEFAVRLEGVVADTADPDLLRAAVAGQPILLHNGITVEPILRLEAIDMTSGNIEFIGSVEIRGDVHSGMRVSAGGDISVGGTVEPAELVSGGNIVVKGGVIGHPPQESKDADKQPTAKLTAKGSIRTRYLENCVVQAEQKIEVDEAIIQSDVTAIDQVIVGHGDAEGSIVGGLVRATALVRAGVLGSAEGTQTRVFVGVNPLLQQALDEHRHRLDAKLKENGELTKVLKLLTARPDKREIADKARLTLKKVNEEIAEILSEEQALKSRLSVADQAKVVAFGCIHGGVTIAIGRKSKFVSDDLGPGVFVVADGSLVYGDVAVHGS